MLPPGRAFPKAGRHQFNGVARRVTEIQRRSTAGPRHLFLDCDSHPDQSGSPGIQRIGPERRGRNGPALVLRGSEDAAGQGRRGDSDRSKTLPFPTRKKTCRPGSRPTTFSPERRCRTVRSDPDSRHKVPSRQRFRSATGLRRSSRFYDGILMWMPHFGATARIRSMSACVTGGGTAFWLATGCPISSNIFSSPAGATQINIRARRSVSFLNACSTPVGTFRSVPGPATCRSPDTWKVTCPSIT